MSVFSASDDPTVVLSLTSKLRCFGGIGRRGLAVSNATLYQVQAEYAAVMQASGDAILAVDSSGAIRSCNKAAAALFGEMRTP